MHGTILGYFEKWANETTNDPDISEDDWISACTEPETEPEEEPFKGAKWDFFKSQADVDPQEPLILKDPLHLHHLGHIHLLHLLHLLGLEVDLLHLAVLLMGSCQYLGIGNLPSHMV